MSVQRKEPNVRKAEIIEAALCCAEQKGFVNFTRDDVATRAGCSPSLVSYHYLDMTGLREDVMEAAVSSQRLRVVGEGLAILHPVAVGAPRGVREAAAAALLLPFAGRN